MFLVEDLSSICPGHIAIIGGGRWGRVLTEVLCTITPKDTIISIYCSNNKKIVKEFVLKNKFRQNITIYNDLSNLSNQNVGAIIVANAARDHEIAIQKALNASIPVLVEKPVTISYSSTLRLVKLAQEKKIFFASGHIFLFSRYLQNFSNLVSHSGELKSINIEWSDPLSENRYGEQKSFDSSLPIFFDLLPHIISIISSIAGKSSIKYKKLLFLKGGSAIEIELMLDGVFCSVSLARNSDERRRIVNVMSDQYFQLDFSQEPGFITKGTRIMSGDDKWNIYSRPAAQMLSAFLVQSVGGQEDPRLDNHLGLQANKLIDEILPSYNIAMISWLTEKLIKPVLIDDDLKYALKEILLVNDYYSKETQPIIDNIIKVFNSDSSSYWLDRIKKASEPFEVIGKIALI
jgi:predicted dehydrogenase